MIRPYTSRAILLSVFLLLPFSVFASTSSVLAVSRSRYSKAHSLGDHYTFDPRDGWRSVNATNLSYKYPRDTRRDTTHPMELAGRNKKKQDHQNNSISSVLHKALEGLKGIGKAQEVKATWYTGHDLENPSCWANGDWKPTDESFACALTQHGWEQDRPQCFQFIELCVTPQKCVFVRVVDSCAGCAEGSHHVDLTRAAFIQLADIDVGVLHGAQLRISTDPVYWYNDLWGPKTAHKKNH